MLSVIVPAFNEEKNISKALDSLINQTSLPEEIIVVDDGSTDRTKDIVSKYIEKYPFIRYHFQVNSGLAASRCTGIKLATQEYIGFLDSDDEWTSNFSSNIKNFFKNNENIKWLTSGYARKYEDGTDAFVKTLDKQYVKNGIIDDYFKVEATNSFSITNTMVINRCVFDKVGLFDTSISKFGEDLDMWFRIALHFPKLGYIDDVSSIYWYRTGSITDISKVDTKRFYTRIKKTESNYKHYDPFWDSPNTLILSWAWKCIKFSIKQGDYIVLGKLSRDYFFYLNMKKKLITIAGLLYTRLFGDY